MAREDKSLAGLFPSAEEQPRNPQADPQENVLHPPEGGQNDERMSEEVRELDPVKGYNRVHVDHKNNNLNNKNPQ
ncbi:hypothetical protein [Domibacillus aminovorans]|uniref:Uncharacterized protein n=1 Tax=Domibacillus aminovorans TaxID=29332 RepID=A0A177LB26_9BACI|nr:hypothetical protein [Domibacillus aminovorans]OAH62684.1 hypothetical protein AWH49_08425 [Domibacillus aminovorans]